MERIFIRSVVSKRGKKGCLMIDVEKLSVISRQCEDDAIIKTIKLIVFIYCFRPLYSKDPEG